MRSLFFTLLLIFSTATKSPIKEALNGSLKSTIEVTTEFSDNAFAIEEVAKNKELFKWMNGGTFTFAKTGTFAFKKKGQKTETGRFSADETRVKLIFDAENLPELNAYNPQVNEKIIVLPFGVGMTKVNLYLHR